MTTCIPNGPHCGKKETKQCQISQIYFIPCTPSWVSKIYSDIWCSSIMTLYIDTSRLKWSFGNLILGYSLPICCQNRAEDQTKDATIWAWEPLTKNTGKGNPNPQNKGQSKHGQYQDKQSKTKAKKDTGKTKKDTGKWCDFHKIPWHNTADCRSKKLMVAEVKASESDAGLDSETKPERGRWIIDTETSATVAITKVQPGEPNETEEGEHLFHSHIWVKGTLLHFIMDSSSQKNLISVEVFK
jgi:hypothetical protein